MMLRTIGLGGVVACLFAGTVSAHHSFAMFDSTRIVSLEGTVSVYEWRNPHIWIHMMAPDAEARMYRWSLELGAPGQLSQRGWAPDTVAPGDTYNRKDGGRSTMAFFFNKGKLFVVEAIILPTNADVGSPDALRFQQSLCFLPRC